MSAANPTDLIRNAERASSTKHPLVVPGSILHPPGMVGLPSGEQARWTQFQMCLAVLERPNGTRIASLSGTYIQALRNELVHELLATSGQWLFMVDDDHTFERSLLINLLDRHVPVVAAAAVCRKPPYIVCAYRPGENHAMTLHEFEGQFEQVDAVGTGAILIRREVFEALDPPWFEVSYDENGRNVSEDVNFCRRARDAGFDIWLDGTQVLGHLTGMSVKPDVRGLKIVLAKEFDLDWEESIVIPKENIEIVEEEAV